MTRVLLVPGRGRMLAGHWMNRWAREHPEYLLVPRDDDPDFDINLRVPALHAAITAADEPAVLVAHSGGCVTVAQWAAAHTGPVAAVLLVTPPYLDPTWEYGPGYENLIMPKVPHLEPLPFPTTVVASRTDEIGPFDRVAGYADAWGATLVDAGEVGHLNTTAGYGPWPAGERLLADLLARADNR
ncbi:alpha/beta hydrolase [Luedemannella flava]|uniref:Alpha/beta hydrolase n=1 Tax=Luedemannella flava TaxID=349316 RepID=A0ABP4XSK8_9ACTN